MIDRLFLGFGFCRRVLIIIILVLCSHITLAYSVLTHEAIIDANWEHVLLPLLKERFPGASPGDLKIAHAYAYGGAVVPDMGYYPFGSHLFTNLVHYVRSGDFVQATMAEARTLNEYAFALGILCHYNADNYGHSLGVNVCVPLIYSKMKKRFGDVVTYDENHLSHLRTEFAFDVLQTARGNYASETYHDFIGFQVAKPVLERAFFKTYGIDLNELFGNFSRTVGTFRWIVKSFFPTITKAAWLSRRDEIRKTLPNATDRSFVYRMHRKTYMKEFHQERPRFSVKLLSLFIDVMPKIGPLRVLRFKLPGKEAEKFFIESFDSTAWYYKKSIAQLKNQDLSLEDINFDTGKKTVLTEYHLADQSYEEWVLKLEKTQFKTVTPAIKKNILNFYDNGKLLTANSGKLNLALTELNEATPLSPTQIPSR